MQPLVFLAGCLLALLAFVHFELAQGVSQHFNIPMFELIPTIVKTSLLALFPAAFLCFVLWTGGIWNTKGPVAGMSIATYGFSYNIWRDEIISKISVLDYQDTFSLLNTSYQEIPWYLSSWFCWTYNVSLIAVLAYCFLMMITSTGRHAY
ncbi:hypothetical protein [Enterovibrio norvegicus]|uniref:hypothetical protein n=1 Tax=Enterovibrio norvegicus TaxID=188144 RepID=UPI00352F1707